MVNLKYFTGEKKFHKSTGCVVENNGSFRAEYRVCGQKAKTRSFPTKEKAQQYLAERIELRNKIYDEISDGVVSPAVAERLIYALLNGERPRESVCLENYSFAEFLEYYIEKSVKVRCENRAAAKKLSVVNYDRVQDGMSFLSNHIASSGIGVMKVTELKPNDFIELVNILKNNGLSNKTIKNIVQFCSQALKYAVELDLIEKNPIRMGIINESINNGCRMNEPKVYTKEQAEAVISAAYSVSLRDGCLIETLAKTGLRRGEALGLKFSDFFHDTNSCLVSRAVVRRAKLVDKDSGNEPRTVVDIDSSLKTSGSLRWVKFPQSLMDKLNELKKHNAGDSDYCFVRDNGTPLDPDYVRTILNRAADIAGVPVIKVHELRNTFATLEFTECHSVGKIQAQLGHTTEQMTRKYISFNPVA